jgi:hypothetical protein
MTKTGADRQMCPAVRRLLAMEQRDELVMFGKELAKQGFTAVRRFLDEVRGYLRSFMDEDVADARILLERLKTAIPEPGSISPSWQDLWKEFSDIVRYKCELLSRIRPEDRGGGDNGEHGGDGGAEWQVLLDNPYSHDHIAVYPSLTFQEAAYMYAYFRTRLEQSEFIRLQKVQTVIMNTGADG